VAKSFTAQVSDWVDDEAQPRLSWIIQSAVNKLVDEVTRGKEKGGLMPIDTRNLAKSLLASSSRAPSVIKGKTDFDNASTTELVILGHEAGDTLWLGFQAAYAARVNFGFTGTDSLGRSYNQTGAFFFESAAAKWPEFVMQAEKEIGDA